MVRLDVEDCDPASILSIKGVYDGPIDAAIDPNNRDNLVVSV